MENKPSQSKTNRVLYLVVVGVLVIVALVIGLTAAFTAERNQTPTPSLPDENQGETNPPEDENPNGGGDTAPEETPTVFLAPASGVVSKYHDASAPVFSITMNDWRVHQGIDIAASLGDEVKATAKGTVKSVWKDPFMGYCVSIDHGNDVVSIYKNLAEELVGNVKVGVTVEAGQVFAAIGESASIENADSPHLHFEMEVAGKQVDPLSYISEESYRASLSVDSSYE